MEAAEHSGGGDLEAIKDLKNGDNPKKAHRGGDDGGIVGKRTSPEKAAGKKEGGIEEAESSRHDPSGGNDLSESIDLSRTCDIAGADGECHGESERNHEGGASAGDRDLVSGHRDFAEAPHHQTGGGERGDLAEHLQARGNANAGVGFQVFAS